MPSLVEIGPVVMEKFFLNLVMYFHYFVNIAPLKECGPLYGI